MPALNFDPFKQIHLDFAMFPEVAWIERIPTKERPNICKVSSFDRTYFLDSIKHSNQTLNVTKRIPITNLLQPGFGFLINPLIYEDVEIVDIESRITISAIGAVAPMLKISVIEIISNNFDQDYDRAMKVIG